MELSKRPIEKLVDALGIEGSWFADDVIEQAAARLRNSIPKPVVIELATNNVGGNYHDVLMKTGKQIICLRRFNFDQSAVPGSLSSRSYTMASAIEYAQNLRTALGINDTEGGCDG